MFIRIVDHWAKPGQTEYGRTFIDENGVKMEKWPGFIYRYRLEPTEGPTIITTLTAWATEEHYRAYRAAQTPYSEMPHYPFERTAHKELVVQASSPGAPA
jgi:heme-degrading monooxygenase HmoA